MHPIESNFKERENRDIKRLKKRIVFSLVFHKSVFLGRVKHIYEYEFAVFEPTKRRADVYFKRWEDS